MAHLGPPLPPYHLHGEDKPAKWPGEALLCRPIRGSSGLERSTPAAMIVTEPRLVRAGQIGRIRGGHELDRSRAPRPGEGAWDNRRCDSQPSQPRYRPGSRSAAKSNVSATRNAWLRHPCGVNELPFYKWSSAVRSTWICRLDSGVPGSRSGLHADTTSGLYYQYHKVNNRPVRSPRYPLFFSDLLR